MSVQNVAQKQMHKYRYKHKTYLWLVTQAKRTPRTVWKCWVGSSRSRTVVTDHVGVREWAFTRGVGPGCDRGGFRTNGSIRFRSGAPHKLLVKLVGHSE